ncbi:unnamed protein product [Euphydryas editha]|uniref:Uncharacterized protein n=1 Tax=Euphydryas editha TaxID=104508 RepID=A0AAU9VB83_EUPED|nr:unnamed protein product [Euphydryas editha]
MLVLRVAVSKTEALLFHGPHRGWGPDEVLGLDLGRPMELWFTFREARSEARERHCYVRQTAAERRRTGLLLPVLIRWHSTEHGTVTIWCDVLTARNKTFLRRPPRVIAVRSIRAYRTVSWTAVTLLASNPP